MEKWNENNDLGCIEGCALADVMQQVMSSLAGGYALLCFCENKSINPNKKKIRDWEKRREEIRVFSKYYTKIDNSYDDIRRWIRVYSEEVRMVESLRKKYADAS
ncbi:MAG: hypothetical protein LBV74_16565 [Tannerella sp.]|jgi:hypothetical protein|nr:hypothetical protein [Tannerella sp.]